MRFSQPKLTNGQVIVKLVDICILIVMRHAPRTHSELRSCVKVEVVVLDSPSLIVLTVSVDVKQH